MPGRPASGARMDPAAAVTIAAVPALAAATAAAQSPG